MGENKGLCSTCINDKHCSFPRRFPVWQCEEYNREGPIIKRVRKKTAGLKKGETRKLHHKR